MRRPGTEGLEQSYAASRVEPADTVGAERTVGGDRDEVEPGVVDRRRPQPTVRVQGDTGRVLHLAVGLYALLPLLFPADLAHGPAILRCATG